MIRQPMLAAKSTDADLQRLKYPLLCSPKIDGIRGVVGGGKLLSRSMKPIRNTATQRAFCDLEGLDGELVVGRPNDPNLMQQTSSGVMSIHGDPMARFFVFDDWTMPFGYGARYGRLQALFSGPMAGRKDVVLVEHTMIHNYESLLILENQFVEQGYEGLMIRSLTGTYKDGRSTLREGGLVKVKRFTDDEATIVGYEPLMRNDNELERDERGYAKRSHSAAGKIADAMLGALVVVGAGSTVRFSIGSGFTAMQRYALWNRRDDLIGKVVKFKHFAVTGVKDVPRMPIFLGFRDKDDM